MLNAIALGNFKAYAQLEELELRPLTVFCGPNAVGKSSVIQALLMMRQTIDVDKQPEKWSGRLVTEGKDVSLGDYKDVVFGQNIGRNLRTELTVPITGGESVVRKEPFFWKSPVTLTLVSEYWIPHYGGGTGQEPGMWEELHARNAVPVLSRLRIRVKDDNGRELVTVDASERSIGDTDVALTFGKGLKHANRYFYAPFGGFDLAGLRFSGQLIEITCDEQALRTAVEFEECFDAPDRRSECPLVTLTDWDDDCGAEELVGLVSRMLKEVSSALTVRYVGPAREAPQRYYDVDRRSMMVGAGRGERDWKADLASGLPNVRKPQDPPKKSRGSFVVFAASLDDTINSWLSYLGLPDVHPVLEGRDFRVLVSSPYAEACPVSVADTGYGVSQVLPILLAGAASREEILVLDQPELHLHPRLQTGMADFAIAVAERRQVLVETHSDHFVNRIVRRVVEGEIGGDDVAVYFFTPTSDGPHVEMVEVDPTFGIKNWPLGFFDDYADEQEAIIRASLRRRSEEGTS